VRVVEREEKKRQAVVKAAYFSLFNKFILFRVILLVICTSNLLQFSHFGLTSFYVGRNKSVLQAFPS
jgi:hypothetical protein